MVLINSEEKNFRVYQLDTVQTIIIRLASLFNNIPVYLYIEGGEESLQNLSENSNIVVEDLLALIRENAKKNTDFAEFLPTIVNKLNKQLEVTKDVLYVWLAYNTEIQSLDKTVILHIGQSLVEAGYFEDIDKFDYFWKSERAGIKRDIESKIKFNQQDNTRNVELFQEFNQIADGLVYTDFKTEKVTLSAVLDLVDISILEIFNNIVLNESVPFSTCRNYYKILKDYVPSDEWAKSTDNITLKVNEKAIVDITKYKDFTTVEIGSNAENQITTEMRLITERGYVSREQFITRLNQAFPKLPIRFSSVQESEVVGVFYFPMERINTYVFADLVMNNKLFSNLINIDESVKATKKKTDGNQPWLYIHFNHNLTGHVTAGITQKIVDRSDPEMREEDIEIFPHGQPYIRVRAKGQDMKAIENFQNILAKLLVIYGQKYNEIVEVYKQFIPDFGIIEEVAVPMKKKKSELIAPDIFIKNYSRNCNEARMPTIISKEDAKVYQEKDQQVMKFPRKPPTEGEVYPSDGKNQQYYVCLNPEYPYPGVQINKLDNSNTYPFVPCCFKTDQKNKKGGLYRLYFYGEQIDVKEKKQQELIITDKFLGPDKYGILSNDLIKLFEVMDTDPQYKYIRVGVFRSPSSFLEAVMVGLHEQTGILELEDEEMRQQRLQEIRMELASKNVIGLSRQSTYDISLEQLQKNVENMEYYLDPKLFSQLLEGYFGCNIFLFNREKMILPRYLQSYYQNRTDNVCIFIYEHWGSESDHAKYPQCELIIRWNTTSAEDTQYSFPNGQKISRGVRKVQQMLTESYALNKQITPIVFPYDKLNIQSQVIDSYGKCRQLNIEYNNTVLSLLLSPIPPLAVQIAIGQEQLPLSQSIDTVVDFIHSVQSELDSQVVVGDMVRQVNCTIGNVLVTIPIQSGAVIEDIPVSQDSPVEVKDISTQSEVQLYNHNKKLARYVVEYCFWLFSKYIQDKKIDTITDKVLAKFAKARLVVQDGFQYPNIPKTFSTDSAVMQGGKLIVQSLDMMKRLMYVLKLFSIRDSITLSNYYLRNTITNYYVDMTDFDQHANQVILQGEDAIDKWIQETKTVYRLSNEIIIGQQSPYFFKNKLVSDDIFLAQNANDLQSALSICIEWHKRGYNEGIYYSDEKYQPGLYTIYLYIYTDSDNIVEKIVPGQKELKGQIRILGYRLAGKPSYTCLLGLE